MDNEEVANEGGVADAVAEVPGELLQLLPYPENVVDIPETQMMQLKSVLSKSKLDKYKKEFFITVCCLVGIEVGRKETSNMSSLYQQCMTIYAGLLNDNGSALLLNTIGLFVYLPNATFPPEIYQSLLEFCAKEFKNESRAASKATKVVVTPSEAQCILRGKVIFDTYSDTRKLVNNQYNNLHREPTSGENLSGVLLQVRMTLFKAYRKGLERDKFMRESKNLPEYAGKGEATDREAWINGKLADFTE